ncbi:GAF domain-containing protein [Nocardioides sp. TRM66260-LWL]|uniref:sensor histidine kinase n=1 Tax=Nocardioides sp. TRM66260-LWL TaxID=2874478 RepID=UPI001CC3B366|nr:GAF domain-containing protein [Nocardioides sp. TRM66260-LWL]MBZ5735784.1 GAF domain-containing protein [Nocardioides sp. TRM66260-LWL]
MPERARKELDGLLREVIDRVELVLDERERIQLLLDAVVALGADLHLDGVLERIVASAGRLVDAQYAALGVVGPAGRGESGRRLLTFVHDGLSDEDVARIGSLPQGHGLLGLIIDRPEPVRLADIAAHDASVGFPADHPPMHSFLGVPVRTRERVFGNLYLTEKRGGGEFTDRDEAIVVALAAAAGVVIENARLYEEAERRQRWLEATAEVTAVLSGADSGVDPLQLVADRARECAGAPLAWISLGTTPQELTMRIVSSADGAGDVAPLTDVSLAESLAAQVVVTGAPISVRDVAESPHALDVARLFGWPDLGPVTLVPLGSASGIEGVLALGWHRGEEDAHAAVDVALVSAFSEQAGLAVQVARAREDQALLALLEDRDRIGRDLHDLVIQRLFAVGLGLERLARRTDDEAQRAGLEQAVDDLDDTIRDIRRSIFALGATATSDDLQAEVTRLVDRAAATLKFRPTLRFDGPVRLLVDDTVAPDLLAVLGEALSNASRHAHATRVAVSLVVEPPAEGAPGRVALEIVDDGRGLPDAPVESGLSNMRLRAERRGGSLLLESGPQAGTRLVWSAPIAGGPATS